MEDCNASLFIDASATIMQHFTPIQYLKNCNASLFIDATATELQAHIKEL